MVDDIKPYQDLANAIVFRAVMDYKNAYDQVRKNPRSRNHQIQLVSLRKFFLSPWFEVLCKADGAFMIRKIEENISDIKVKSIAQHERDFVLW